MSIDDQALDKAAREGYAVRCKTNGPRVLEQYASPDIMQMQLNDARVIVSAYLSALSTPADIEPVGYVSVPELGQLKMGVSCVDLFSEPQSGGINFAPVYAAPVADREPVAWAPREHLDFLAIGRAENRPSSAIVHDRPNQEMGWTIPLYERTTHAPQLIPNAADAVNPMQFFSENVDRWGAAEWFGRLAMAIREQDKACVAKDDIGFETYRMIAASSAMTLVRDHEATVRAALAGQGEKQP